MSMKIPNPNEEGTEIEVFTAEEKAIADAERDAAKAEAQTAQAEVEKYKRVAAEQTQNFKKLNEMSEEEKSKFSASQLEDRRRLEAAEARAAAAEDLVNRENQTRVDREKAAALAKYHGGDEKLKEILEKNYGMINLEGNDSDTILKRAEMAANMERGKNARVNPLMSSYQGSAPAHKDQSRREEFMKSDKAKEAERRMGN